MITITDIRINLVKGDDKLKAYATIIINDSFLVSDLRVIESDDGFFVENVTGVSRTLPIH